MNTDFATASETHVYKPKLWVFLLNVFYVIFFVIIIGIPLSILIATIASFFQSGKNYGALPLIFLAAFSPVIVLLGIAGLQVIVGILSIFLQNIKITPEGIENKIWPYRNIRSRWSEVDRLGKFIFYDVVYLKSYEVIGFSLSYVWPFKYLNFLQPSIALSTYKGWPEGQLADDLKHYAPQLFERQLAAEEIQTPVPGTNGSSISQENRLLAALAHASVLIIGPGILVPLVVYATQKKKSTYLAFHALQAFFYQLVGFIFSVVLPICLTGAIVIPIFVTAISGKEMVFTPFFAVMFFITMLVSVLLGLGGFVYSTYGVIGAIQAYQGKDFRYLIIGNRVAKRS